ncbi:amidohydrolase [Burkholderia lata]|uniref:Amidohydrolase n=1 Tax=Burkholderia lata (strain ATCC 17760 / DSM 23089 / LMG 22485 / NCIMB 9086 / R18194 / 383) TaxID=482957 RepID=A0A6P2K6E1_BURL3|nr:amidohydrolase [Burkholderia lata]VWB52726.1 amidohydrolase [Burkholderia lata]
MFHRHQLGCACCSPHLVATALGQGEHEWQDLLKELNLLEAHRAPEAVIFHGGHIYPDPEDTSRQVGALGIADHKVIATGTLDDVRRRVREKFPEAREQGLKDNQTLLPGLIDPHMHVLPSAVFETKPWIDLSPFENQRLRRDYGETYITARLNDAVRNARNLNEQWVSGIGVDPSLMSEWLDIDSDWLNKISTDICLFLVNASGHLGYANSAALKAAGLEDNKTKGVLTESQVVQVMKCMPQPKPVDLLSKIRDILHDANKRGITTLFDAGLGMGIGFYEVVLMQALAKTGLMTVRVGAALFGNSYLRQLWLNQFKPQLDSQPEELFTIRAMKLIADGSNQGLTGLQRQPYTCCEQHSVPGVGPNGLFNFNPIETLGQIMQEVVAAEWPVLTHANGDEAIANVLAAYQLALSKVPPPLPVPPSVPPHPTKAPVELRHRIEHASLLSDDDLRTMKRLSVSPSFLIGHVGYWGRAFQKTILGEERAQKLDRCKSALREGLRISLHSDRFVSPLGPLRYMDQAIGRVMEADPEHAVLNEAECLSPAEALRAVTIDAAWQCHLDDQIGSLKEGKQADLVILEQDPLQATPGGSPYQLREIPVLETWVSGRKVYERSTR